MKVSICCITYNHDKYIGQAIEGFLMQQTNFNYEVIIGDDSSTDCTAKICADYQKKYPDKIKLIKNGANIGMTPNFVQTLNKCLGNYIALCEGDDFWIDPLKLQNQVDFLEANSEYVGCFHNTEERFENDNNKASFLYCNYPSAKSIDFEELSYGNLIPTCSVMFRKKIGDEYPEWYFKLKMADWPLHLLNAQYGPFWYIPKVMAVHRLHHLSVWMLQDPNRNNQFVIDAYDIMIHGFVDKKNYSDQLIKAKKSFIEKIQSKTLKLGFTERVKRFAIRMIERI